MARPKIVPSLESRWAQLGEAHEFKFTLEDAELAQPLFPTSATITVTDSGDNALSPAVSGASMTVAGEVVTYSLASASLPAEPEQRLRAEVSVVVSGTTWTKLYFFDVVRFSPTIPARAAEMAELIPGFSNLGNESDPDNAKAMRMAWLELLTWLTRLDIYPDVAIDTEDLRLGFVYLTAAWIYRRNSMGDDAYAAQADHWQAKFDAWAQGARITIDANRNAIIEEDEDAHYAQVRFLGRSHSGLAT